MTNLVLVNYLLAHVYLFLRNNPASIAPNFNILLLARILQAIGAGLNAFRLSSNDATLSKEKRGAALGLVGIVIAFAPAIGPTLSGLVVDKWGWHTIFAIIFPNHTCLFLP